jgi:general transcriptional corepressor TUP1
VTSQLNEVNIIRRSLYELDSQQSKVRQHYEDEINRLRAEIASLRQNLPTSHTAPSAGIPGLSPPPSSHGHATSTSANVADPFLRDRDRERTKERGHTGPPMPPPLDSERDIEKSRERREVDRVLSQRNPKPRICETIGPGMPYCCCFTRTPVMTGHIGILGIRSPRDGDMTTKLQPLHSLNIGPSAITLPPRLGELSDYQGPLPPLNIRPQSRASGELSPHNALLEFRKVEGSDWFALHNPKAKKSLDINLMHSFTHPR